MQDSAYPYHDWNQRITAECYAPNAASRILGPDNRIVKIVSNYARISFNFGPTLLSWLEEKAPKTYRAILEADRESAGNFSGHGSAMAQAYNHMILPLANRRDKRTQIVWGLRDFQHRFGRAPEGMWLPETAVDLETLDLLAENGVKFTILAPRQTSRVRKLGSRSWKDVSGERIDPTRAYQVRLPSRRQISVFFYDGPISRSVSFERLLDNGEQFANRLLTGFSDQRDWPQLVHIATDGESYGHHHHFGEMALSYAVDHLQSNNLAQITNYAEFLERHPPTHIVQIVENSSWSCVHGVERWKSDCGCNSGGHGDWNQRWRAPLRHALDWLRDTLVPLYEEKANSLLRDPWLARQEYIGVILDRSPENVSRFLTQHAGRELTETERITAVKLLELQRHAMLMYTSCGWFFDELSGIETVQVIHYAGRSVQLAKEVFGDSAIEAGFLAKLAEAQSNIPEHKNGAHIYEKFVTPAVVDLPKLAAHYAIASMFEPYDEHAPVYCYTVDREEYMTQEAGKMRLAAGRARIISNITGESDELAFGTLHFGDHNVSGGVRHFSNHDEFTEAVTRLTESFSKADTPEVLRLLDQKFGKNIYSLRSLFRDEQNKIIRLILGRTLSEAEHTLRQLYEQHVPLMHFLADLGVKQPKLFKALAGLALNKEIGDALGREQLDQERIESLLREAAIMAVELDKETLEFIVRRQAERTAEIFWSDPTTDNLGRLENIVHFARNLPFPVNLWEVENLCAQKMNSSLGEARARAEQGDDLAKTWVQRFSALAEDLHLRVA